MQASIDERNIAIVARSSSRISSAKVSHPHRKTMSIVSSSITVLL
jgi:hypothetical protein